MVHRVVTDPDAFFRRRAASPSTVRPALLLALTGLLGAGDQVLIRQRLQAAFPGGGGGAALGALAAVATGLLRVALVWLLVAGGLHLLSLRLGDPAGGFRRTAALVGWGFVPLTALAALGTAVTAAVVSGVPSPATPEEVGTFLRTLDGNGYLRTLEWLPLVFLGWQAVLWWFALHRGQRVSARTATTAVAAVVTPMAAWLGYLAVATPPRWLLQLPVVGSLLVGGGVP